jgi:hypothetical protein
MLNGQVKSVMKNSLVKFSKELKISLQDFRIKMKLDESLEHPICIAMEKTTELKMLNWDSILGLKSMFKNSITSVIRDRLHTLSDANNVDKKDINIRFYAVDINGTPKIHFYNGLKAVKEISIDDFI